MAGRRRRTKHQQMKEQYNLLHRLPRPLSPRPSEPTLLPTTLPSLIQYNMATSCVAGQTLPASLPACQPAVPVRRRCCLPSLQCAHTLKAPCPPGHSLIPVYPTTRSHLPPLQQTKVLPKLHLPYSLLELLFYYHPVLIRLQAASCLPEVQDSRPVSPSTQLSPVHVPTRWPAYTCLHLPTPAWLPTPARSLPYLPPALCKTSLCTRANQLHFGPPVCWLFSVPRLVAPPQPGYQLAYTFPSTQLRRGVFREIHRETYWSKYSLFEKVDYKPMSSSIV